MPGRILDGRPVAAELRARIKVDADAFLTERGVRPTLAILWAGDDPASAHYARQTEATCQRSGLRAEAHFLPGDTTEAELLRHLEGLNRRDDVHGILVEVPLPPQIAFDAVSRAISIDKDVDGVSPVSAGLLLHGKGEYLAPATPLGGIHLLREAGIEIAGRDAVVVGRGPTVGKPMALLLLNEHATVTVCHSRSRDLATLVRRAEIVVTAVGRPGLIAGGMLAPGAIVVDFGTTIVDGRVVGDVDFASALEVAGAITPVPGGTGPLTVAMLMRNTLTAAARQTGRPTAIMGL